MKKFFVILAVAFVAASNCFANLQFSFDIVEKPINYSNLDFSSVRGENLGNYKGSITKLLEFGFQAGIIYFFDSDIGKMLFYTLDDDSEENQQENQTGISKYQGGIYFDFEMLSYGKSKFKIKENDATKYVLDDKVDGKDFSLALGFCGRYNKSEKFFFDLKGGFYGGYIAFESNKNSYDVKSFAAGLELGFSANYKVFKTQKFTTAFSLGCEMNVGSCFGTLHESGYQDTVFDLFSESTEIGIEVHAGVKFIL